MSAISTPSHISSYTSRRGMSVVLAVLVLGAAGGAAASAGLVHGQVRIVHDIQTVFVPGAGSPSASDSDLCYPGHRCGR